MKVQSAKAKGRKLQQWFTKILVDVLGMDSEDMESRPMGSQGEDVIMGKFSRARFPYSIECKNQESVNVWKAYAQAEENCKGYEPLVVIKRNRSNPLVLVDAQHFVGLFKKDNEDYLVRGIKIGEEDLFNSSETRVGRLKQAKINDALTEVRNMNEEESSRQRQWDNLEDDR